jgi:hypothetical protein
MTVVTRDVCPLVPRVRKLQICRRNLDSGHRHRSRWIKPFVAVATTGGRRRYPLGLCAIDRVAARTDALGRKETIAGLLARASICVAPIARDTANRQVLLVIEAQRNPLRADDGTRRAALLSARKLPHARPGAQRRWAAANSARRTPCEHDQEDQRCVQSRSHHGLAPTTIVAPSLKRWPATPL